MKYQLITLIIAVTAILSPLLRAQVTCTAKAPEQVYAGDTFKLSYELNEKADKLPTIDFPNFKCRETPGIKTSRSLSVFNGEMNSSQSYTYTYTLIAEQEGTFTFPGVTFTVESQTVTSNPITIVVRASSQDPQSDEDRHAINDEEQLFIPASSTPIEPVTCTAKAPEQVFVGNTFKLSYELNAKADTLPTIDFPNFIKDEKAIGQSRSSSMSIINGDTNSIHSFNYIYTLTAEREGTFIFPGVTFTVNNQPVTSNPITVRAVKSKENNK